jgi:RNA polymerase sigma-70 factor (ECF subfamily)
MAKDNTLIHRAQSGDEGAFVELIRVYYPFVYAIVIGIVNNPHDAEEVVQDTFLNAYHGLAEYQEMAKFKNWLGEIARNRARSWLRKQRIDTVPIDEVNEQTFGTQDLPEEQLMRSEQRELIRRAMGTLSEKDREIAQAYYLDGASYDELTETHGLSYNAIAFRLSRAKRQLTKRLRYLLTGIFVSPAMTLKKFYSGSLTSMKAGMVPKITIGVAALIALIFIGFVTVRQMNAPTVEERVYLSPWEDGTERSRNSGEDLAVQTNSAQDTENRDNQSQSSTEGSELVEDSLGQPDETDTAQFTAEAEFEIETDPDLFTDISTLLDDEGRLAEDVMDAYVEALRSLDVEGILSLITGDAKEEFESVMLPLLKGELPKEMVDMYHSVAHSMLPPEQADEMVDDLIQTATEGMLPVLKQMLSSAEVVSSEYVGDELHFQVRISSPEIPGASGLGIPEMPKMPDQLNKIRKENGVWRIYNAP